MVTTRRTTRGLIITICNYDFYQNPKNYESQAESQMESQTSATIAPDHKQELKNDNINKRKKTKSG